MAVMTPEDIAKARTEIERLQAENTKLLAFAGAIMRAQSEATYYPDGDDIDHLLVAHGLRRKVEATAEDCAEEWAQEYDLVVGDEILEPTELGRRALAALEGTKQ